MSSSVGNTTGGRIVGTGWYQPPRVLTNDDLAQMVETNDEWIRTRTGIVTRHIAGDDDTVVSMATHAARAALADAGVAAGEVTQVIVATCSNEERSPSAAGRVAELLGAGTAVSFDVGAACSGFVHALALADQSVAAGASSVSVVIGSEKLSAWTDFTDRSTCILVGDGAGAVVVRSDDVTGGGADDGTPAGAQVGEAALPAISPVSWGTVRGMTDAVEISPPDWHFSQNGRAVLRWALTQGPELARSAVERAGLRMEDVGVFVAHQANLRIIEPLVDSLGLREDAVVAKDVAESGNTSAASIPLALAKLRDQGRVAPGARALLFGFGGGFSWAGQVVTLPG
jgi:3-oxoacyl-[acyl-carrier-protein] synthase-3